MKCSRSRTHRIDVISFDREDAILPSNFDKYEGPLINKIFFINETNDRAKREKSSRLFLKNRSLKKLDYLQARCNKLHLSCITEAITFYSFI